MNYGVFGGKTFGGKYKTVNKYFKKKESAKKFVKNYKMKYPKRKLTMFKIKEGY